MVMNCVITLCHQFSILYLFFTIVNYNIIYWQWKQVGEKCGLKLNVIRVIDQCDIKKLMQCNFILYTTPRTMYGSTFNVT